MAKMAHYTTQTSKSSLDWMVSSGLLSPQTPLQKPYDASHYQPGRHANNRSNDGRPKVEGIVLVCLVALRSRDDYQPGGDGAEHQPIEQQ